MSKTQAERARLYRQRKRGVNGAGDGQEQEHRDGTVPNHVTLRDGNVTECDAPGVEESGIGPLDVYSHDRWTYLQSRGHVWDPGKQRGVRADGVVGVVVPGDPAYGEAGKGKCRTCGESVDHIVDKCLECCIEDRPSAPSARPTTFDDLPLDVQRSIDKHCAENNKGDRAGSHSRAAMVERALHYLQDVQRGAGQVQSGARSYIDHCTEDSGVTA